MARRWARAVFGAAQLPCLQALGARRRPPLTLASATRPRPTPSLGATTHYCSGRVPLVGARTLTLVDCSKPSICVSSSMRMRCTSLRAAAEGGAGQVRATA